jgi:hypothetical protein
VMVRALGNAFPEQRSTCLDIFGALTEQ